MKTKMTNKEYKGPILVISSFFIGVVVGILVLSNFIPKGNNTNDITKSIKKVKDAVVTIETRNGSVRESTGTGFVYKTTLNKAYLITNQHVVDNLGVTVINSKGEETEGTVIGSDAKLDIAIVEIPKKYALKKVTFGSSDKVEIGEEIFTIGSPMGREYAGTVTMGIISGKERKVPTVMEDYNEWYMNVLQFDANINPGSSGGPLFNKDGEVIGVCVMKLIQNEIEGMGFAIPIEQVKTYLDTLEKGKDIEWPELGIAMVEVGNVAELNSRGITVPEDIYSGIVVLEIKENSNADNKLKVGDIITKIDNEEISESSEVKYGLMTHKKGDTITIKVIRNGKEKNINITLK